MYLNDLFLCCPLDTQLQGGRSFIVGHDPKYLGLSFLSFGCRIKKGYKRRRKRGREERGGEEKGEREREKGEDRGSQVMNKHFLEETAE